MSVKNNSKGPSASPISAAALSKAIAVAEAEVAAAKSRASAAADSLRNAERELALLLELGRLRGASPELAEKEADSANAAPVITFSESRSSRSSDRDALVGAVVDVLKESGEPMAIRPLMAAVVERGAPIPGRGEQANLISVIRRVPEIQRVSRGIYGLAEWNQVGGESENGSRTGRGQTEAER